jgi:hypothetical protein
VSLTVGFESCLKDQSALGSELKQLKSKTSADVEFHKMVREYQVKVVGAKAIKKQVKDLKKILSKKKFGSLAEWKSAPDDLPQTSAAPLMPPSGSIWRANKVGAWMIHVQGHARHSETWAKHGGSSLEALQSCLRFAWDQYLTDHNLTREDCPIEGLF